MLVMWCLLATTNRLMYAGNPLCLNKTDEASGFSVYRRAAVIRIMRDHQKYFMKAQNKGIPFELALCLFTHLFLLLFAD